MASEEDLTQVESEEGDMECTQEGTSVVKTQKELGEEYALLKGNFKEFAVLFTPTGATEALFLYAHVDDAQRAYGAVASLCDSAIPATNPRKNGMSGKSFGLALRNSKLELEVFNSVPMDLLTGTEVKPVMKGHSSFLTQDNSIRYGRLGTVSFINAPAGMPPPPKPKPNPIIALRKKYVLRATSLETSVVALREALSEATTVPELQDVLSSLGPSLLASAVLVQPEADRPPPSAPLPPAPRILQLPSGSDRKRKRSRSRSPARSPPPPSFPSASDQPKRKNRGEAEYRRFCQLREGAIKAKQHLERYANKNAHRVQNQKASAILQSARATKCYYGLDCRDRSKCLFLHPDRNKDLYALRNIHARLIKWKNVPNRKSYGFIDVNNTRTYCSRKQMNASPPKVPCSVVIGRFQRPTNSDQFPVAIDVRMVEFVE
jgi:hypothetical protein